MRRRFIISLSHDPSDESTRAGHGTSKTTMFCTFGEQGEQDWAVVDRKGSPSCNRIGTRIDARIIRFVLLRRDLSKVGIELAVAGSAIDQGVM